MIKNEKLKRKYLKKARTVAKRKKQDSLPVHSTSCIESIDEIEYHRNVNKELKRLLLASVSSDVQHEIECLVKEKCQLKYSLDTSIKHLIECNEELDQLLVECDMWRSKVLASRVLIDELMDWKSHQSQYYHKSRVAMETLLKEREELCSYVVQCHQLITNITSGLKRSVCDISSQYSGLKVATVSPIQLLPSAEGCTVIELAKSNCTTAEVILEKVHEEKKLSLATSPPVVSLLSTVPTLGEHLAKKALYPIERTASTNRSLDVIPHLSYREKDLISKRRPLPSSWTTYDKDTHNLLAIHYCPKCKGQLKTV